MRLPRLVAALAVPAALALVSPCAAGLPALEAAGLSGSIALDYFSSDHDLDDRRDFPGLSLVLKQRRQLTEDLRWVGEVRLLAEQVGHEHQDGEHGSVRALRYSDEVVSELREGYLELGRGRLELRVGKQIIAWGRADEINPTDVLSPKDFVLLRPAGQPDYRFGVSAVKVDYYLGPRLRATAVWVPFFSPSVIPLEDPPPGVRLSERLPAARVSDGTVGVKLDRSATSIDASLAYVYGFNLLPEVHVESTALDSAGAPRGSAVLVHSRQHMVGADFATARGRWGYRGEVAYVHTDNAHGHSVDGVTPYLAYVLGVERNFGDDVSVIVQYVGRYVFARVDPARALADPDPVRGQARFLAARETTMINQELDTVQNGWSARVARMFWNDTLECELLGVHFFERNDFFLRPRLSYALTDAWRATVGGEVFQGPRHSFFGRLERNTGAFVELAYAF